MGKFNLNMPQIKLIEKYLNGEFNQFTASEAEQDLFGDILDKAEDLLEELDAYETYGGDLVKWYFEQYKKHTSR